ncbi:hypothetical protein ACWD4B_02175 [Streptomyces sp. NPDC002536]
MTALQLLLEEEPETGYWPCTMTSYVTSPK